MNDGGIGKPRIISRRAGHVGRRAVLLGGVVWLANASWVDADAGAAQFHLNALPMR